MQISTKTAVRGLLAAGVVAIAALTLGGCPQPGGPTDEEKLIALKDNATKWAHNLATFSYDIPGVPDIIPDTNFSGTYDELTSEQQIAVDDAIAALELNTNVQNAVLTAFKEVLSEAARPSASIIPDFTNTVSRATPATTNVQIALAATRQANGIV